MDSWSYTEEDGTLLGQQVTALNRVGLYVPDGKAAYPSSVMMNAIPAKVAGVPELIMVVPTPHGELNELVLAAAHITGVDKVFPEGAAQAVAGHRVCASGRQNRESINGLRARGVLVKNLHGAHSSFDQCLHIPVGTAGKQCLY